MKKNEENQREYFRVTDTVGLGYHPVSRAVAMDAHSDLDDHMSAQFRIMSELHHIELESRYILRVIADKDRNVADYLRILDRRIDLLAKLVTQGKDGISDLPTQTANLSEGGIEFCADEQLEAGSFVALRLVLLPAHTALLLFGKIAHSDPESGSDPQKFVTGAEFVRESEAERQILARHILQLQLAQRRTQASKGIETIS